MDDLIEGLRRGDRRALSRFLSRIETDPAAAEPGLMALYPLAGHARTVGITGPPGAGKSTLVAALAQELRARGGTVAVLAIDPSSPLTGGALLGDRIRMQGLARDAGVFVRSMGSRGMVGGLSATTLDAMLALDAFGFAHILLETVGAGQDEVDVRHAAQSVVLVQPPGAGDAIQALKAGVLEVADCYVVNKADQPGADLMAAELHTLLGLAPATAWAPPVVLTIATQGEGLPALADALDRHRTHLAHSGEGALWQATRTAFHIDSLVRRRLLARLQASLGQHGRLQGWAGLVQRGDLTPYDAAREAYDTAAREISAELSE